MFFFDLDGTLLDSTGVWMDIDVEFLGKHGISPVPADYTWYVTHHSAPDAARYTRERYNLPETAEEIVAAWGEMALEAYSHELPLKPGAGRFLRWCAELGVPMAMLTSCLPHLCRPALERHGIAGLFQAVLTTGETGLEKGDGALYRMAAERFGLAPEACTLFEDNPGYCAAAKQAGYQVVGIFDPLFASRQEELRALCGPGRYLKDFADVEPERFL